MWSSSLGQRPDSDRRLEVLSSHFWEYQLAVLLVRVLGRMRASAALLTGRLLGYFVFDILRIRRRVAVRNLSESFPEKRHREIVRLARRTYGNLGRVMVEFCRFPLLARRGALESLVEARGVEHLFRAREGGRGAVVASGHFGNWEMTAARLAAEVHSLKALAARQRNRAVDRLINQHRRAVNVHPLRVGASVKQALRALRNNAFVFIAADQDAGKRGIFLEFLGRPASCAQGPAAIALRERCPLILALDVMGACGKHTVFVELLADGAQMECTPSNVKALTEVYNKRLEEYVRRYPDQWFWAHRRWKTRPRGEASVR